MSYNFMHPTFIEESDKALRRIFGKHIKGNFLIEMRHMIVRSFPQILQYYDLRISLDKTLTGSDTNCEFDICRLIVGCHSSNIIFLSDDERVKLERSDEYKKKLTQQVIQNIKLRYYGSSFFRHKPILNGELFINYNVPYNLFVIAMRMVELLCQRNSESNFDYLYYKISNKSLAVLTLLEDNFLDNCFPGCRVVIELYLKLYLSKINPNLLEKYGQFVEFEIRQSCCEQEYPKEFNELFKNRTNKSIANKVDYLHYGWVDTIPNYHNIVKNKPYSINGILTYLKINEPNKADYFEEIGRFYKMCHRYAHGNTTEAKYPILHYFEISEILHYTLFDTYKLLCEELGSDGHINGIDMYTKEEVDFQLLHSQYMKRSTENFDNHYKKKY